MHPTLCMKAENMMLTLLIPGPTAPSNNIDVYLAPLIDDLKDLWHEALGSLAGCKVKGKQACIVCGKDTPSRWLKFSRKHVYLGNRKRLRPDHPYRRRKKWFDNTVEKGSARRVQTVVEICEMFKDFRNDFGKCIVKKGKRKRKGISEDEELLNDESDEDGVKWRWKKRSIMFELPYWKDMPVRHNIDVMHVEKNVSDSMLVMLMQSVKSKDGEKGKRTYLPPAAYWMSKSEKITFCKRLSSFRGSDGYSANISNCVSVDPSMIGGLKSHDHHVLLQKGPRIAVIRLCNFFKRLCQRVIDPEKLISLEAKCVETFFQLERYFPPTLFDIMYHLPIHLARKARLGGPVHFRWMYPFERYMKTLKAYVKNYGRPEACMAEGYLAGECIAFCMEFLQNSVPVQETINRNEDVGSSRGILEGHPFQKAAQVVLSDKERDIAHRYVLMNMAVMSPYVDMHIEELQSMDVRCRKSETLLWKLHAERFSQWVKDNIPGNSEHHSEKLRWLAHGPRKIAQTYKGFVINGHRFHTKDVMRKTQNSGVTYEAFSISRASARDNRQMADMVVFYGVIQQIIMLDYYMFHIPIFKCKWANKGNGVKEEEGFTLVNLNVNQSAYLQDPYILASQAKQVFYSRDDSSSWSVVMRASPRGYHELETEEEFVVAPSIPQNEDFGNESSDDESFFDREDCEGVLVVD
ncbi:PREDICTED: uncharacterized protein LOC104767530 [Camelina sativa]|uniref:Uncharacterized protein LOC104767530 n=1 Tax=Camelina sativa TaxID=90675 RepID=A0ABM0XRI5_CAMSA|nr:PREDICTED: uncharacterized protein LOC104767530 [Camelina sativa]